MHHSSEAGPTESSLARVDHRLRSGIYTLWGSGCMMQLSIVVDGTLT